MSIALALVEQLESVAAEHQAERIVAVSVRAGVLRQIVPEALEMAFETAAEGTCAEGATLELEIAPAIARCRRCGHRFQPELDSFLCPRCEQADVEIVEGEDIVLTSITAEQPEGTPSHED
ncbi:MAG: hydrogenase maturation nickel metallochaperone HypA [Planctomycetota bacterium]